MTHPAGYVSFRYDEREVLMSKMKNLIPEVERPFFSIKLENQFMIYPKLNTKISTYGFDISSSRMLANLWLITILNILG